MKEDFYSRSRHARKITIPLKYWDLRQAYESLQLIQATIACPFIKELVRSQN
jgi:hypothetical protein